MKFLIYETVEDAQTRNHAMACNATWPTWVPQTMSDTPYKFALTTFPLYNDNDVLIYDGPEAVMSIPDEYAESDLLTEREKNNLYNTKAQVLAALQA